MIACNVTRSAKFIFYFHSNVQNLLAQIISSVTLEAASKLLGSILPSTLIFLQRMLYMGLQPLSWSSRKWDNNGSYPQPESTYNCVVQAKFLCLIQYPLKSQNKTCLNDWLANTHALVWVDVKWHLQSSWRCHLYYIQRLSWPLVFGRVSNRWV